MELPEQIEFRVPYELAGSAVVQIIFVTPHNNQRNRIVLSHE